MRVVPALGCAPDGCYAKAMFVLRDAIASDCQSLTALCMRSKAHWGYDSTFMELSRSVLTVTEATLREYPTRVAVAGQRLVGVVATSMTEPDEAELELLFVDPPSMGQGVGRLLLADALTRLANLGCARLHILSDPCAEPFYLRMGARREGLRPSDAIPGRMLPFLLLHIARG